MQEDASFLKWGRGWGVVVSLEGCNSHTPGLPPLSCEHPIPEDGCVWGGGGQYEAKGFWAQVRGWGWWLLHLMSRRHADSSFIPHHPVGEKTSGPQTRGDLGRAGGWGDDPGVPLAADSRLPPPPRAARQSNIRLIFKKQRPGSGTLRAIPPHPSSPFPQLPEFLRRTGHAQAVDRSLLGFAEA